MKPTTEARTSHITTMLTASLAGLDLLKIGVVITDGENRLLLANRRAMEILKDRDGLELSGDGSLLLSADHRALPVRAMLGQTQIASPKDEVTTRIGRPSGKRPLTVIVKFATFMGLTHSHSATGLVFIMDPERRVTVDQSDLQHRYGLTVAECNLANCLVEGMDVNACCARLNIRRSTARMHLRSLFIKTRTRRQAELVVLLFKNHGLVDLGQGPSQDSENFLSSTLVDNFPESS